MNRPAFARLKKPPLIETEGIDNTKDIGGMCQEVRSRGNADLDEAYLFDFSGLCSCAIFQVLDYNSIYLCVSGNHKTYSRESGRP